MLRYFDPVQVTFNNTIFFFVGWPHWIHVSLVMFPDEYTQVQAHESSEAYFRTNSKVFFGYFDLNKIVVKMKIDNYRGALH